MDKDYFLNIERHCQQTKHHNFETIHPTRKCIKNIYGEEIKKNNLSGIPINTLETMVSNANRKYNKTLNDIKNRILASKRKGITKYQTLGYKQSKEIKLWCEENNINCNIVEEPSITRNKLTNIDIWHDTEGNLYDNGCRDYGNMWIDYRNTRQNVIYIQVSRY